MPRVFISSTLSENLSIRKKIENFYSIIGANAMLYEKNLTPSVNIMTYRKDILDADFIILIIKNNYGHRTDRGISGTHEELQIALETKIPMHVYIKLNADETDAKELVEEINKEQISYYYFKNDNDLLKRIKETTFTIAKDIMLKKIVDAELPSTTVKKMSVKQDYDKAIKFIKIIETMKQIQNNLALDFIKTNIFDSFIEPIKYYVEEHSWIFINEKLEILLQEMLNIYDEFSTHSYDYTGAIGHDRTIIVPVIGEILISNCTVSTPKPRHSRDEYIDIINRFLIKFEDFKKYIGEMKIASDIL